jgi:hypothetical protein
VKLGQLTEFSREALNAKKKLEEKSETKRNEIQNLDQQLKEAHY